MDPNFNSYWESNIIHHLVSHHRIVKIDSDKGTAWNVNIQTFLIYNEFKCLQQMFREKVNLNNNAMDEKS